MGSNGCGMINTLKNLLRDQQGVTAVEYGMIMAMIAISTMAVMNDIGNNMNAVFTVISDTLQGAGRAS